jgi:hypothetical protein
VGYQVSASMYYYYGKRVATGQRRCRERWSRSESEGR